MGNIALQQAIEKSGKASKNLARLLWPDASPRAQYQNMRLLLNGTNKRVTIDQIQIICEFTGVDANYLFGI